MLVTIWHLLSDSETRFNDLGTDHFARHVNTETKKRTHVRQLEALGYTVTLEPAAEQCIGMIPGSAGSCRLPTHLHFRTSHPAPCGAARSGLKIGW